MTSAVVIYLSGGHASNYDGHCESHVCSANERNIPVKFIIFWP